MSPAAPRRHAEQRATLPGYSLDQLIAEYRLLRRILLEELEAEGPLPFNVRAVIHDVLDRAIEGASRDYRLCTQQALQASEERYRRIVETATEGVWLVDAAAHTTYVNQRMAEMLGYTVEEMVGRPVSDFVFPEDRSELRRKLERRRLGIMEEHDFRYRRRDGKEVWAIVSTRPIFDDRGTFEGVLAMVTDVTWRKLAEDAMRLLSEASRTLANSLDYETTLDRVTHLFVPRLADWCLIDVVQENGVVRREGVRQSGSDPDAVEAVLRRFAPDLHSISPAARVIRSGEAVLCDEITEAHLEQLDLAPEHLEALRQIRPHAALAVPLLARGRTLGAVTLLASHSGRSYDENCLALVQELVGRAALALDNARLFQELQQADENKTRFLALLGHELRNPLGPIRNGVRILELLAPEHPLACRALETIKRQLRHETRLIDDLLNITRIARGKLLLSFQQVDLRELVRSTVEDHRSEVEQTGLHLELELPDEAVFVRGDPTRLAQVLDNLLQNATKFTDAGGTVSVRLVPSDNGEWAVLQVRDTGIGIRPDLLPHLFDPFVQDNRSCERGGLGLGLALAQGLVQMHGGEIRAASAGSGLGAEFIVQLPRERAPAPAEPSPSPATDAPVLRVLVIEDNRDAAETMRDLLELYGHEVRVALDGPTGVEAAREFRPQVVLCDIQLPGMSGYDVARTLREDPATHATRLIAVTGYGLAEDRHNAHQAGFHEHLVKPVDPEALQRLIASGGAEVDLTS